MLNCFLHHFNACFCQLKGSAQLAQRIEPGGTHTASWAFEWQSLALHTLMTAGQRHKQQLSTALQIDSCRLAVWYIAWFPQAIPDSQCLQAG